MDKSVLKTVLWSCVRPFQLLFFEQMCLNLCLLSAILLGILYLFFGVSSSGVQSFRFEVADSDKAFAVVFETNHDFNQWQTGLTFLGILVGMMIGVACDHFWLRNCELWSICLWKSGINLHTDLRLVRNNKGLSEPEFRLPPTIW